MSQRHRSISMLIAVVVLVFSVSALSIATTFAVVHARAQARGPAHTANFTLDNVALTVQSPTLPSPTFAVSAPTSISQAASAEAGPPFHALSIFTIPFGTASSDLGLPPAHAGGAADYASLLTAKATQAGAVSTAGPVASLFGQNISGRASRIGKRLPGLMGSTPTAYVQWVVEAGNRLWVVTEERWAGNAQSDNAAVPFGASLTISSPNPDQPTTIPGQAATSTPSPTMATTSGAVMVHPEAAPGVRSSPLSKAANTSQLIPATLQTPSWWSGTCDVNHHPGYLLTIGSGPVDGLQVCSPSSSTLGGGVWVSFFTGDTVGALEWQCVELSLRYMYLSWFVNPYSMHNAHTIADSFPFSTHSGVIEVQNNNTPGQYPQPGDVIQMSDYGSTPDPGHTGVVESASVDSSGSGTITVVTENGNLTGREHLQVGASGGLPAWHVGGDGPNFTTAWLHRYAGAPFGVGYDYQGNPAAYARSADGSVWTATQPANGSWGTWTSLGGRITSAPVFGHDYQGRTALYVRGADGALYTAVQGTNGAWIAHLDGNGDLNNWTSLGGVLVSDPAFGYDYLGRPAVFVVGTTGAVYATVQSTNGTWGAFSSLNGTWTSNPAFGYDYQGNPAVFARGTDGALYTTVQNTYGSWGAWTSLGGVLTSNPVFGRDYQARPAVFVRGTDGALFTRVQNTNGSWSDFTSLGGVLASDPVFGYDYQGHPAVYVVGTNGAVFTTVQNTNGSWGAFTSLGGVFTSAPVFGRDYQARPAVFGIGTDRALYTAVQGTNGVWITHLDGNGDPNIWTPLGGSWQ
jgi:hypothetical protein